MAQATSWVVETLEEVEGTLAEEETLVEEVNVWNVYIECDFCFFNSCVSWFKHVTHVQENILICFVFQEAMGVVVAVVGAEEALGVVTDTMDLVMVSVLFACLFVFFPPMG